MTEVLIALIALVPSLIGLANGRRRQLATIKNEIEVFVALPKGMKHARAKMRADIASSVNHYSERRSRHYDLFITFGFSIGWLMLVLGYSVYSDQLTDNETRDTFRKLAGSALLGIGSVIVLVGIVGNVIRVWRLAGIARRAVRIVSLRRRADQLDRQVNIMEQRAETSRRYSDYLVQYARNHGVTPPPMHPEMAREMVEWRGRDDAERATKVDMQALRDDLLHKVHMKRYEFKQRIKMDQGREVSLPHGEDREDSSSPKSSS